MATVTRVRGGLTETLRSTFKVNWAAASPSTALAGGLGFVVPLALGAALGNLPDGVAVATGALIVGFANLGGPYRRRGIAMAVATVGVALSALIGGLTGASDAGAVILMGLWGFGAGMAVVLGAGPAFVALLSAWALLFAASLSLDPLGALREGGLILLGGAFQTLLALGTWPLRRQVPERAAVAAAFGNLARCAAAPGPATLRQGAASLSAAVRALGQDPLAPRQGGPDDPLTGLVNEGEWIRLELAAAVGGSGSAPPGAAEALADIAATLRARPRRLRPLQVVRAGGDMEGAGTATVVGAAQTPGPADDLGGHLAVASQLAAAAVQHPGRSKASPRAHWRSQILTGALTLRANLTVRSAVFRHAVRLSGALMAGVVAYRVLPLQRGYWVPLTVLFILKPDFGTTFARGSARVVGTVAGVALGTALSALVSAHTGAEVALLGVAAVAGYAIYPANYGLFTMVFTLAVALLAPLGGASALGALQDRMIDTALGVALAAAAYALWPTWERSRLGGNLAEVVTAYGAWLGSILSSLASPAPPDQELLRRRRLAARLARTNAQNSVHKFLAEPTPRPSARAAAPQILLQCDLLATVALGLLAAAYQRPRTPRPQLTTLGQELELDLASVAVRLSHCVPPRHVGTPATNRAQERRAPVPSGPAPEAGDPVMVAAGRLGPIAAALDRLSTELASGEAPRAAWP